MSYSATSEALSDPLAFPYFAQVVPPDVAQAAVMVEMAKDVGWNSICSMFQDDDYGTRGALATSSKACAEGHGGDRGELRRQDPQRHRGCRDHHAGCRINVLWCTELVHNSAP